MPNYDEKTGIHYGCIHQRAVGVEALQDFFQGVIDLDYLDALADMHGRLSEAIRGVIEGETSDDCQEAVLADAAKALNEHFAENYKPQNPRIRYDKWNHVIETYLDVNLIVIKSPYFTYCRPCSPCVPNAGDLDSPDETGFKSYCLGFSWFDENTPCPYQVYSVETGKLVEKEVACAS